MNSSALKPSSDRLAVIVPFRNRLAHLRSFAPLMEVFLARQNIQARIIVVHQNDNFPFNRGTLLNIGYLFAEASSDYVCFHDVDLIPLDDSCDYGPSDMPVHLAGKAAQYQHLLPYASYCGGVVTFSKRVFTAINGFSNLYWGWGREDDDLYLRMLAHGFSLRRRPGHYASLAHSPAPRVATGINTAILKSRLSALPHDVLANRSELAHLRAFCENNSLPVSAPPPSSADGLNTTQFHLDRRIGLACVSQFDPPLAAHHEFISVTLSRHD